MPAPAAAAAPAGRRSTAELIAAAAPALGRRRPVVLERRVANTDRSVGALLAGEIVRRAGPGGLPDDPIVLRLHGCAGQSLAAWAPRGLTVRLEGACNDYAGKGLSGGRLTVRPPAAPATWPSDSVLVGNTVLYGATGGEAFFRGRAGERFAVRNSGATRGGGGRRRPRLRVHDRRRRARCWARPGRNFAAGMSGGLAYVYDPGGRPAGR